MAANIETLEQVREHNEDGYKYGFVTEIEMVTIRPKTDTLPSIRYVSYNFAFDLKMFLYR